MRINDRYSIKRLKLRANKLSRLCIKHFTKNFFTIHLPLQSLFFAKIFKQYKILLVLKGNVYCSQCV